MLCQLISIGIALNSVAHNININIVFNVHMPCLSQFDDDVEIEVEE